MASQGRLARVHMSHNDQVHVSIIAGIPDGVVHLRVSPVQCGLINLDRLDLLLVLLRIASIKLFLLLNHLFLLFFFPLLNHYFLFDLRFHVGLAGFYTLLQLELQLLLSLILVIVVVLQSSLDLLPCELTLAYLSHHPVDVGLLHTLFFLLRLLVFLQLLLTLAQCDLSLILWVVLLLAIVPVIVVEVICVEILHSSCHLHAILINKGVVVRCLLLFLIIV